MARPRADIDWDAHARQHEFRTYTICVLGITQDIEARAVEIITRMSGMHMREFVKMLPKGSKRWLEVETNMVIAVSPLTR